MLLVSANGHKPGVLMIFDDDSSGGMPPVKRGRRGVSDADDEDDDYRKRRDRNNEVRLTIVTRDGSRTADPPAPRHPYRVS